MGKRENRCEWLSFHYRLPNSTIFSKILTKHNTDLQANGVRCTALNSHLQELQLLLFVCCQEGVFHFSLGLCFQTERTIFNRNELVTSPLTQIQKIPLCAINL